MRDEMYSNKSNREYREAFARILEPVLRANGFRRITRPDGWFSPMELFEIDNRWFGSSWDWRDRYLDFHHGRMFAFEDVLPSVVILGPLRMAVDCSSQSVEYEVEMSLVTQRLPELLEHYERTCAEAIARQLSPSGVADRKGRRGFAEFRIRIGKEITLAEWHGATAS